MRYATIGFLILTLTATTAFCGAVRGDAAEFPPGLFTDGGQYHVEDFHGKVLVLYFFEQECPTARGMVPEWNKLVESMKGKPVKFVAIGPNDSLTDVAMYAKDTKLEMPIFADKMGLMQLRYHENISLKNICQFKVIDAEGRVVAFTPAGIAPAVAQAKWKYKDDNYDKKLAQAVELFEWNQYEAGMKVLKPFLKNSDKAVAESANKLFGVIKAEGEQWKTDAAAAVDSEPVTAYDKYTKLATVFAGDELGKAADEPLKKLKTVQAVKDELAARKAWTDLAKPMSTATDKQKPEVLKFCLSLAKKYPGTPTAEKASALADELQTTAAAK